MGIRSLLPKVDSPNVSLPGLKCHCLRKCSRDEKLWSTDLAETWLRSWV